MDNTLRNYPSPLASYEQVVSDKDLFMSTLKKFHSKMGTQFWIPNIRRGDLNLHKLFVEVTSRGGIEQVIREVKWKDVIASTLPERFRYPIISNQTRRNYYSLLHDYEIVYFSKTRDQEWTGFVSAKNEDGYVVTLIMGSWKLEGVLDESIKKKLTQDSQRRSLTDKANPQELSKTKNVQLNKGNKFFKKEEKRPVRAETTTHMEKSSDLTDTSMLSVPVSIVLDGRFDDGYLVTVTIGPEIVKGVMYPQSPPLNTVTQKKKLDEDEKTVNKEKAVVEDKEKEDQNCSDDHKTVAQLLSEAKSERQFSSKLTSEIKDDLSDASSERTVSD